MSNNFTVLWVGDRHQTPEVAAGLKKGGYNVLTSSDIAGTLAILRNKSVDLIVLENETSCVQGELAAVRMKSAAPHVPILLLCDPTDTGQPQAFFVNLILATRTSPELLLRSIRTLLPHSGRKTGT